MKFENKIYSNAFWMMSEKIITIFGLLFVTSFVAKYVGPMTFGQISLSIAIFQIVQVIAQMGGDNIIFKRVSKKEHSGVILMQASTLLRGGSYLLISILVVLYFTFMVKGDAYVYVMAVACAYFFTSIDVFSIFNNAKLRSKLNTFSNIVGLVIGLSMQYCIAFYKLNPYILSIPIILTTFVPYVIKRWVFYKDNELITSSYLSINPKLIKVYSKYMLLAGVGIVISSISVAVYSRINQFTLGIVDDITSVGIYSVAITLGTSWGFVSQSLITSFYSKIYAENDEETAIQMASKLNRLVLFISLFFVIFMFLFGHFILQILYGKSYASAYQPMLILCLASLFSSLGTVAYRYVIRMSGYYFLSKKMLLLLIISIPLSYFFTKLYGINGAALCTVFIEFLSLTVMNYFFSNAVIWKIHKVSFFKWW